jgi:predicted transcriptional regulator
MEGYRPEYNRYVYIYCSSVDQKKKFQELAGKTGTPLSKFLLTVIEEAISQQARAAPRERASESMRALEEELQKLREESRLNEKLLKKYEAENRRLREVAKFGDDFEGERRLDAELITTLQRGPAHDYRLLEILGIEPGDTVQAAAVQKQLQILEMHGLISKGPRGWTWSKK